MKDFVFNHKDIPWIKHETGKTKTLFDKELLGSSSIRIFNLEPETQYETHEHSHFQIMIFVNDTEGEVILDEERTYPIRAGLTVVVRANQCHKIINKSKETMEIIVVDCYNELSNFTPFVDF